MALARLLQHDSQGILWRQALVNKALPGIVEPDLRPCRAILDKKAQPALVIIVAGVGNAGNVVPGVLQVLKCTACTAREIQPRAA